VRPDCSLRWIAVLSGLLVIGAVARAEDTAGHFAISRYDVQGNSLLPAAELDATLAPYTGPSSDFETVQTAVEALEAVYRDHGYGLVRVVLPEQELDNGVVRLRVIERRIGTVKVEGNDHFSDENIRASVPALLPGKIPDLGDVSAELKLANESPAKQTTLQVQNASQEDQVNAVLKVSDAAPWTVGAGIDNTGDNQTGRDRLTLHYQNADIGGWDHVLSLQYTTSLNDPHAVGIYGLGYHIPIYDWGDSVDLYASYSDVNSGTVSTGLLDLAVSGKGAVGGARYNHVLPRLGDFESKLILGVDYKAFETDIGYNGVPLGDNVTVHPISLTYALTWPVLDGAFNAYASGSRNIPGGDNGGSGAFETARAGATADYTIFRYGAAFQRPLPGDMQLRLQLNGQETSDALIPGEQLGAGGATTVRGFDEREFANDRGRIANAELYSPDLCGTKDTQCRVLGFYDAAWLSRNDSLPGEESHEDIASVGAGARITIEDCLARLDYGYVLQGLDSTRRGASRIHFSVQLNY